MKIGMADADPVTLLAWRYGLIVLLLLPIFAVLRPPLPASGRQWLHLVVTGLLLQVLYFCCAYISVYMGMSPGALALILSMQPILVGFFVPWTSQERVNTLHWLGLALGLAGAALVITSRSAVDASSYTSLFVAFGALISITAATLYEKRFGVQQHIVTANLVQYAVGFVFVLPLAYMLEEMRFDLTPSLAWVLFYLVVGNSIVAISLLMVLIRRGEAAKVSALFFLVPPVAAALSWLGLGESMPLIAWFGMGIAATGLALVSSPRARHKSPAKGQAV